MLFVRWPCWRWRGAAIAADERQARRFSTARRSTGWKQLGGAADYKVIDGAIVGSSRPGVPNSFLVTEKDYGDFILEFDVRQDVGPDQFRRAVPQPAARPISRTAACTVTRPTSIRRPRQWSGSIYEEAQRGWFYTGEMNPPAKALYKFGEWNHYRVEAIGPRLRVWINDGAGRGRHRRRHEARVSSACRCTRINSPEEAGRTTSWKNLAVQTKNLKRSAADGHLHPQQPAQQSRSGGEGAGLAPAVGRQDHARLAQRATPRLSRPRAGRWPMASWRCAPRAAAATS